MKFDPKETLITTKLLGIFADLVWLSLYIRDNEKVQHPWRPLAPTWAELKNTHTENDREQLACLALNYIVVSLMCSDCCEHDPAMSDWIYGMNI
jgi:hypothetical protein